MQGTKQRYVQVQTQTKNINECLERLVNYSSMNINRSIQTHTRNDVVSCSLEWIKLGFPKPSHDVGSLHHYLEREMQ